MSTTTLAIIDTIESVVAVAAAGRLTGVSASVQNIVHTFDQQADEKIDALQAALDKDETSNPLVQTVLTDLGNIAKASGFSLPSESHVFAGIKAAVDDLAGSLKPVAA